MLAALGILNRRMAPEGPLSVSIFPAAKIGGNIVRAGAFYGIEAHDFVLLRHRIKELVHVSRSTSWARLDAFFRFTDTDYAQVTFCKRALDSARSDPLCPQTAAPLLVLSDVQAIIPIDCIWQRVYIIKHPREQAFWVNWYVMWGPAAYPVEHFDDIIGRYRFPNA